MKLLDRLAIHSLIKTITDFILKLVSLFKNNEKQEIEVTPKKKRPILDKIKKWLEK